METKQINFADCIALMKRRDSMHVRNLISYLKALENYFGNEVAKIVEDTSCRNAFEKYKNLEIGKEDRTIEKLINILWEPGQLYGCQYTYKKENDGFQFNCTA